MPCTLRIIVVWCIESPNHGKGVVTTSTLARCVALTAVWSLQIQNIFDTPKWLMIDTHALWSCMAAQVVSDAGTAVNLKVRQKIEKFTHLEQTWLLDFSLYQPWSSETLILHCPAHKAIWWEVWMCMHVLTGMRNS